MIDHCVSLHFKADNVWAHFDGLDRDNFPSPQELFQAALSLYDNYSNPKANAVFMAGCPDDSVVLVGEPWREEEDTEPKPVPTQADDMDTEGGKREGGDEEGKGEESEDEEEEGEGGDEEGGGEGAVKEGESPKKQEDASAKDKSFDGDHVLARSALLMYEALVSKEVAQAVAEGDIGRVYEGIKVSCWVNLGVMFLTVQ